MASDTRATASRLHHPSPTGNSSNSHKRKSNSSWRAQTTNNACTYKTNGWVISLGTLPFCVLNTLPTSPASTAAHAGWQPVSPSPVYKPVLQWNEWQARFNGLGGKSPHQPWIRDGCRDRIQHTWAQMPVLEVSRHLKSLNSGCIPHLMLKWGLGCQPLESLAQGAFSRRAWGAEFDLGKCSTSSRWVFCFPFQFNPEQW